MHDELKTLRELVAKHCDEELSNEERETLNDLLRTSPALRREYASLMELHANLMTHPGLPGKVVPFPIRRQTVWKWTAAAAAAIIILLLALPRNEAVQQAPSFATLIQATECEWLGKASPVEGERLGKSDLRLDHGTALIRFFDGVEISLQAPSHLEILGPNAATLHQGELYFSNDMSDEDVSFSLSTPQGELLDIGTSYSVAVKENGVEEVHVEDGKVIRLDESGQEFTVGAGQAMRWLAKGQSEAIPYKAKPNALRRAEWRAGQGKPIAWFSFVDQEGYGFPDGWKPWGESARGKTLIEGDFSSNGYQPTERSVIAAPLKLPIDMSKNGVTYFSLFCTIEDASNASRMFYFAFRESSSPDHKAQFTLTPKRRTIGAHLLYADDDSAGRSTMALALPPNGTKFQIAGKIISRASEPDQVFLRLLPEHEPLESVEPFAWSVVGQRVDCDFRFDLVSIHFNTGGNLAVSDLNLGKTWESATNPQRK